MHGKIILRLNSQFRELQQHKNKEKKMSIRINHAKNFKGKAYVAADELDKLIQSLTLAGTPDRTSTENTWKLDFTYADQTGTEKKVAADLTAIKDYIDKGIADKAITVDAGAGITIDTSNALKPVISADVDGSTIVLSGEGNTAKLASGLKIKKLDTATQGYAASYTLADKDGNAIAGAGVIDIVKDQFIGSAKFGWSTVEDSTGTGWTETKSETAKFPCIKIEVWTNTDGNAESSETTLTPLYIPLAKVFQEYEGHNGVAIVSGNVISGVVDTAASESVYTAKGATAAVLSVGTAGFKVTNIQSAIDNAVTTEHETASAAIETLEGAVKSFANDTNAAVTALNTRIEAVASNAQTAAGNAQANAIAYAAGVADNAQSAVQTVGAAVDALDTKVSEAITSVNTNVENAIDTTIGNVNTAINANVTAVNTNVGNAVASVNEKVNGSIDNVNTQVTAFKETVNATVGTVKTAMDNLATGVNNAVTARSTQLTNAVEVVDTTVAIEPAEYTAHAGVVTKTVEAKYIMAVYGKGGMQIYPEITRGNEIENTGVYTFTLSADYGASPAEADKDGQWNIICVKPLPAYTSASVAATGYSNTIAYTDAEKATNATYSPVTKTDAAAVDAADVNYTVDTAVAGTTVDKGSAGKAETTVANGTAATPPATTGIAVEKNPPVYK